MKDGDTRLAARGEREIVITRAFDAPRRLVFEAMTSPELLPRWLGVRAGWSLEVCQVDLRPGGAYRYVWRHAGRGAEMGMGGVFREVSPPERIVATERFDQPWYPGGAVWTTELAEQDGRTAMTMTVEYESREARDAVIASPAGEGMAESHARLDEVLVSIV